MVKGFGIQKVDGIALSPKEKGTSEEYLKLFIISEGLSGKFGGIRG